MAQSADAGRSGHVEPLRLAFVTHLDMDMPEQDVYIERQPGSGEVFRVTTGDHDMSAPLYAAAHEVDHNPFDPAAIGPHPKGDALGMTLGEWLAHKGSGTYTCDSGEGRLDLALSGLVPDGVYTIWHAFVAIPPPEPFTGTLDLPLGARDGSESVFTAGPDGTARVSRTFRPCLQMSDVWTTSMLAINYHSDGKTWAGHPGEFGHNAHIPLFVMLPPREGI
ncbi:MAG: hypothetical protein RRA92_05100 [Gemmatimonadota bacterium]|nr:hypothetical protein [Gemmatimonadota bacterium]